MSFWPANTQYFDNMILVHILSYDKLISTEFKTQRQRFKNYPYFIITEKLLVCTGENICHERIFDVFVFDKISPTPLS